jgi:23S rRNA pseudouridine955/2504/2580 synthase
LTQNHPQVRKLAISSREDGQRVDNFLIKQLAGVPKSHIYRLLRSGQVRVNGGRVKPERKLVAGDEVRVPPVRAAEKGEAVRPPDALLKRLRDAIVHEDEHYLALSKPSGLPAHAGSGAPYGVIEAARAWGRHDFLELCHRLDRDTSGVLLLAKTRPALLRAQRAFKHGEADKRYFALLVGRWRGEDRDVDAALLRNLNVAGERRVRVDEEEGKPSKSRFSPKARYRNATLCEVKIFSGRTHQIRVHAAALGCPVAGDDKYGEREDNRRLRDFGLKRMFLHSHFLALPAAGEFPKLLLNAPLPEELREVLERLQRA